MEKIGSYLFGWSSLRRDAKRPKGSMRRAVTLGRASAKRINDRELAETEPIEEHEEGALGKINL